MNHSEIKLTQFSHGGGCGCKIAPQVLDQILNKQNQTQQDFKNLLVGNNTKDDAAVYQINEKEAIISTTDFFTPIINDPFTFGQVAAANAISDVYAMGGKPIMALAILGWPLEKIPLEAAQQVMAGAQTICTKAQIPLAGGHSIDTTEPIFGLSVNGMVDIENLKTNHKAQSGDYILLTQALGVGVLATAEKRNIIEPQHQSILYKKLTHLNSIGKDLGAIVGVHALTDVTGFGLAGHLLEMANGAGLSATIEFSKVPYLPGVKTYLSKHIMPDATSRNWKSYGEQIKIESSVSFMDAFQIMPDPQTNGGLLIAVAPDALEEVQDLLKANGYEDCIEPIGKFSTPKEKALILV